MVMESWRQRQIWLKIRPPSLRSSTTFFEAVGEETVAIVNQATTVEVVVPPMVKKTGVKMAEDLATLVTELVLEDINV